MTIINQLGDPFAILGPHDGELRVLLPGARSVQAISPGDGRILAELIQTDPIGLFTGPLPPNIPYRLRIDWHGITQETEDPYSFRPLLGQIDLHLLAEGRHHDLGACLGAHVMLVNGVAGVRFAVWAPNARRVSVVGDFNTWDDRRHPMRLRHDAGVWELFIPRLAAGALYKYSIIAADGFRLPAKADPVASQAQAAPATASIVPGPEPFVWTDAAFLDTRAARHQPNQPMSIYEVHAGSWMRPDAKNLDWDALGDRLIPYAHDMGFTHLEFMPIASHPFGGSWGYQPLGLFAPAAEFGPPDAFARLVDRCHDAGLAVILDWVPGHFPNDAHGLVHFDGTALYEHADPREGLHRDWDTLIYNFGRNEVRGFLIASALHWLEKFHIDGLRVDAVASMLYRDYSRQPGEWTPNIHGGRENLAAIALLRDLSHVIAQRCPGCVMIAEESTAWPGVSAPADDTNPFHLGFSRKWNMGWMHDTLHYVQTDPIHRRYHHDQMSFGMIYAYTERFVLPLSHDEVVHGKGSLINKMPGGRWQRFANLRAYFGFMWSHPGKKLLFMGGEFAQSREWNHDVSLDWHLLDEPDHRGMQRLVRDLNRLYRALPALHARDDDPGGFQWAINDDRAQSVFAFLRFGPEGAAPVLMVSNFTPVPRHDYHVRVPHTGRWIECFNSDATVYGGSGVGNAGQVWTRDDPAFLSLTLPPLSTIILRLEPAA